MKLKKSTFLQGAFIATLGIVLSKILGIIYVIPFYAIIGNQGGALYGYAYNIYAIFLGISQAGVPLAMSRLISEYNALEYYEAKERIYKVGRTFLNIIGIISFLILFFSAPFIAEGIIGGVKNGNTVEDVTFVIRLISTAILVVPILSVSRGYLQGHNYIGPTPVSQVLEQIVRIIIILVGSYVTLKVFNLPLRFAVGCSVFAATIGATVSYLYIYYKIKKNKDVLELKSKKKEPKLTNMDILKMIMLYAVPFILIEMFRSIFNSVDVMMLVKTLVNTYGFATSDAETVMSVISTWGLKLNMIIISIVAGLMTSLIPSLTKSIVKKNKKEINKMVNQTLQVILSIALPMTLGLSFLTTPVWNVFYGVSTYGIATYRLLVFVAFSTTIFSACLTITQLMKEYKYVVIGLILGFVTKVSLNLPMMALFNKLGIYPFYGAIATTILGFGLSSLFCLILVIKKHNLNIMSTFKELGNIIVGVILMLGVMFIMRMFIPLYVENRLLSMAVAVLYAAVGGSVYLLYMIKTKTFERILGESILKKIKDKLQKKKK